MDEDLIKQTAEEAINDLELDCEVRDVGRTPKGDEWRIQFSGSYSPFCDKFQDQFERENSFSVVREKIKRHLLSQVEKIRRSAGKSRRPKAKPTGTSQAESSLLTAPLKMIGDALNNVSQFAGDVIERAGGVANAARQTVANASDKIFPVEIEVSGSSNAVAAKKSRKPLARKTGKSKKAQTKRAVRKARKTSSRTGKKSKKQAKKVSKTAAKSSRKAKKAAAKKAKKVRP